MFERITLDLPLPTPQLPNSPTPNSQLYLPIQYEALIATVFLGGSANRSRESRDRLKVPGALAKRSRPCDHTTYTTEPGRYSHRVTRLERNCRKSTPPGADVTAGSTY